MWDYLLSRSLWEHPGAIVTLKRPIRKWKDREAWTEGQSVEIIEYRDDGSQYGSDPKLLVRAASGTERWMDPTDLDGFPEPRKIIERGS